METPILVETVPLDALKTRWSRLRLRPPDRVHSLRRSMLADGQLTPLLVCCQLGALEVVDGFKRLEAARQLKWSTLIVRHLEGDGVHAKVAMVLANRRCGLEELELAWSVRALRRDDHLTQSEIGRLLGRHKSWVCRRLALAEQLEASLEDDVRLGLLSATAARELARLPRGNQRSVADVVVEQALTSRETTRLVDAALTAPAVPPHTLLPPKPLTPNKARPKRRTPGERITADITSLTQTATRLQVRLRHQVTRPSEEYLREGLESLEGLLLSLLDTIRLLTKKEVP